MVSRYDKFINNGTIELVPFISIIKQNTDYYIYYNSLMTRMDILSYEYYGDANYGWLILQANPEIGSLEFNIPNDTLIRIPYPLENALASYIQDIKKYKEIYGTK